MKIKAETLFLRARNISIPIFPKNYRTILALCQDKSVSSKQLASIIETDYGLSLRLLRFVNSAFFSLEKNEFYSFQHIVVLLGLDNLRNNILKAKTLEPKKAGIDSIYIGIGLFISFVSEKIITSLNLDANKARVCGMLQNIGEVTASLAIPKITQMSLLPGSFVIEKRRFVRFCGGYDPRSLGEDLAKFWNLPELIRVAINPSNFDIKGLPKDEQIIILTVFYLNELIKIAISRTPKKIKITSCLLKLEDKTGLKQEKLEDLFFEARYDFQKRCPFFHNILENINLFKRLGIG